MVIDIHTHAFPNAIAQKTIEFLKGKMLEQSKLRIENATDGTVDGLLASMDRCGIDISFVMPIATKISQAKTINDHAEKIKSERIISFGSVHPADPNCEHVLYDLAERGFIGIKLHPEFQDFYIDSAESVRLIKCADRLGLYTLIHAGGDLGYPPPYHCTPERLVRAVSAIAPSRLIAAHLGGFMMWDEVMRSVVKQPIYIDTAAVGNCIPNDVYRDIIRAHGADKVLFGSDLPWEDQAHALAALEATGITREELDMIEYKNALRLFGAQLGISEK